MADEGYIQGAKKRTTRYKESDEVLAARAALADEKERKEKAKNTPPVREARMDPKKTEALKESDKFLAERRAKQKAEAKAQQDEKDAKIPIQKDLGKGTTGPIAGKTRIVAKGDTLSSLAKATRSTVEEIKRLNPNIKGTTIKVGEKVKLPKLGQGRK